MTGHNNPDMSMDGECTLTAQRSLALNFRIRLRFIKVLVGFSAGFHANTAVRTMLLKNKAT